MGIGNDIKPKKVYRYKPEHHYDPFSLHEHHEDKKEEEPKEAHSKSSPARTLSHNDTEELEDDFFHDYNKTTKKKVKKERSSGGFLFQNLNAKNITWLLIIALIVIVIYQNFDSIKGIFIKGGNTSKNSNTSDEYYEGVETNQNSNSGDVNSNLNANVNANLNTNTAAASPTVDKSSITLKVLNGNGIAGSADKVAAILKTAGFLPAKSANARKFTYPQTLIYYRTGQEEAANLVKVALPALTTTLQNSDSIVGTYDVIVVTGKK